MQIAVRLTRGREARPTVSRAETDHAVIDAARRGDRGAFGRLHDRFATMVHAVLLTTVARSDADDLVQDVFLLALRKIHTLKDPAAIGGWLMTLARRRAADHHRRRARLRPLPEEMPAPRTPAAEAREALTAIRSLPEAYRETLMMRLVEGMTGPEIAAATGLTPGSVRVNLHRCMKRLRSLLGEEKES